MIRLRLQDHEDPAASYVAELQEFESTLYWVTDRLGLAVSERYEAGWGNVILLFAHQGKLDLLLKTSKDKEVAPPAKAMEKHRKLLDALKSYVEDFQQEITEEIAEQFHKSVLSRLQGVARSPSILTEIHEFSLFLDERDTIELFLDGSEAFWCSVGQRQKVLSVDDPIKSYVLSKARTALIKECPSTVLKELNLPWLPQSYWWRHIEWS